MAARVISRGSRAVLSTLKGPAGRPSACCPASRNVLAELSRQRLKSELSSPGNQDGNSLGSVTKDKDKSTADDFHFHRPVPFRYHRKRADVKEAVDVSDGSASFKALFSEFGVYFFHHDGNPAGEHRNLLPNIWLRDNCRCSKCVNQETMQRSFNILTSPLPTPPPLEVQLEQRGVRITWTHERHESFYDWNFIKRHLGSSGRTKPPIEHQLWGAEIKRDPPSVTYAEVMNSDDGMAKMTDLIMRFGLVFVNDTPFDDSIHTKQLLERIGPIRETHYGGFYDFIPDMAKADTAYTNIALAAHTDTTYFTDPAGLQAFHLLSHTPSPGEPDASGGESLLVDGFHAAKVLRESHERYFKILGRKSLPWHASGNEGVTITPERLYPVLSLDRFGETVLGVRWNADDRGVLPLKQPRSKWSHGEQMRWYFAAAKWEEILRSKELEYWYQLRPGTTVIFNNHRVLHGRSAFTGLRRICGGYISMDDFLSRWRNSNFPREEVLAQVIG